MSGRALIHSEVLRERLMHTRQLTPCVIGTDCRAGTQFLSKGHSNAPVVFSCKSNLLHTPNNVDAMFHPSSYVLYMYCRVRLVT